MATPSMMSPLTGSYSWEGSRMRRVRPTASTRRNHVRTQMMTTLSSAPSTSALLKPNESTAVGRRLARRSATSETANPTTSESRWAASVTMASDPARRPPTTSAAMNTSAMPVAMSSWRSASRRELVLGLGGAAITGFDLDRDLDARGLAPTSRSRSRALGREPAARRRCPDGREAGVPGSRQRPE